MSVSTLAPIHAHHYTPTHTHTYSHTYSEEYELELRNPIANLLSGRIARLVLIQLQFVKKELLVAMQAIDELFNANQVNLQLLAITPVFVSLFALQVSECMVVWVYVCMCENDAVVSLLALRGSV